MEGGASGTFAGVQTQVVAPSWVGGVARALAGDRPHHSACHIGEDLGTGAEMATAMADKCDVARRLHGAVELPEDKTFRIGCAARALGSTVMPSPIAVRDLAVDAVRTGG